MPTRNWTLQQAITLSVRETHMFNSEREIFISSWSDNTAGIDSVSERELLRDSWDMSPVWDSGTYDLGRHRSHFAFSVSSVDIWSRFRSLFLGIRIVNDIHWRRVRLITAAPIHTLVTGIACIWLLTRDIQSFMGHTNRERDIHIVRGTFTSWVTCNAALTDAPSAVVCQLELKYKRDYPKAYTCILIKPQTFDTYDPVTQCVAPLPACVCIQKKRFPGSFLDIKTDKDISAKNRQRY